MARSRFIALFQKILNAGMRRGVKRLSARSITRVISALTLVAMLAALLPPLSLGAEPPGKNDRIGRGQGGDWQEVKVTPVAPPGAQVTLPVNEPVGPEQDPISAAQAGAPALSAMAASSITLVAAPEYLNFFAVTAGSNPASQPLYLRNIGGGTLDYSIQEDIPWLSLTPASGSLAGEVDTVTISVDSAGLAAGGSPFVGTLTITDLANPANSRPVRVRLGLDTLDRRTTLYSYDSNGNLQRRINANGTIVDYEYDSLNRLTRMAYPDGSTVSYRYDANGNRTEMTDSTWGTAAYEYDEWNRLIEVDYPNLEPIRYEYDQADNLTKIIYPNGNVVTYGYDADNRLTTVTDTTGTTTYSYNPATGNLAGKSLPNGVTTTYGYDADGQLTDVNHSKSGTLISSYHYTLDANGNRTSVVETTPAGTKTTDYTYDALYRLSSVTYANGRTVSYQYDAAGNRLKMIAPEGTTDYSYDADNRLLQAGPDKFYYDRNGNLTARTTPTQTIHYSYDFENRLVSYQAISTTVQFIYDGDGNRIAKIVDGVRTNYVNDINGLLTQVLGEADANWQAKKSYTLGLDRISQQETGVDPSFYLYDSPLRSVTGVADASGALVNTYEYDAFGETIAHTGDVDNVYTYNGEQNDPETGLIFLRYRYYDPHIGRFLTPDPVQGLLDSSQSLNPYSFVENNPINFIDPLGLASWKQRLWDGTVATIGLAANIVALAGAGALIAAPEPGTTALGLFILTQSSLSLQSSYARLTNAVVGEKVLPDNLPGGIGEIAAGDLGKAFDMGTGIFTSRISGNAPSRLGDWVGNLDSIIGSSETTWQSGQSIKNSLTPYINNEPSTSSLDEAVNSALDAGTLGNLDITRRNGYFPPPPPPGGDLGGVSLDLTADLMLQINDIAGATYDEKTGQVVFFGQEDISLPEMDLDDLAVAVYSVYGGQDPGVSIDPPVVGGQFSVRYEGETRKTEFGWVMFESDRVLKILSLGRDNLTGQPVTSGVPGYQNMLNRYLASGDCTPGESSTRFWFRPKEVRLVKSASGSSMVFDAVSMEVLTESKFEGGVVGDPEAEAFAAHFTQHYAEFAQEYPILKDLERLGKIVAVVKWIKDNDIPLDASFLDNYSIEVFATPDQTPSIIVEGDNGTCFITLEGGVTYRPPNEYLADDPQHPVTEAMSQAALAQRPDEAQFIWEFTPPAEATALGTLAAGEYTAVAQSLARSRKDGNVTLAQTDLSFPVTGEFALNLTRYYDSFWDKPTGFGFGWAETPFVLRFPRDRQTFSFGDTLVLDVYEEIFVLERPQGREDTYTLLGADNSDQPLYRRQGSGELLRENADGTFTLFKKDQSQIWFNASGQLIGFVDSNGNQLNYGYTGERLTSIVHTSGRQISLSYDGLGRITQAVGPGGRSVTYSYDAGGNLTGVTNQASGQAITFTYDADRHLVRAVDNEGNVIFDHSYDIYGRATGQTFGQDAPFDFNFDLENRRTVVTDPFGRQTRLTFDEKYRPLQQTDALGYAVSLAYAGDFGPSLVSDAYGATTGFEYDSNGNVTAIVHARGGRTDLYYAGPDLLIAMEDPLGLQSAFHYDDNGNLTTVYHDVELVFDGDGNLVMYYSNPNNVTILAYDSVGNLIAVTDPKGNQRNFSYDSYGMITGVEEASGQDTAYTYDALSRLKQISRGGSNVNFGYDNADNLTSISTMAGSVSYGYDGNNNLAIITDAKGKQTHFDYDQDNNLTQVIDAADKTTQYGYDVVGNLTSVVLPNNTVISYEYDELGRPIRVSSGEITKASPPQDNSKVFLPVLFKSK